jgi:hypothetical protein
MQGTSQHNTLWRGNAAGARGGGLLADGGTVLLEHTAWLDNTAALGGGIAGLGMIRLRNSIISGSRGGDCAATLTGSGNLLDDTTCGLPARPATGLADDGRPAFDSNALDALPTDQCRSEVDGLPVAADLRGQPRPADSDGDGATRCDIGPEFHRGCHCPQSIAGRRYALRLRRRSRPFALSTAQRRQAFEVAPWRLPADADPRDELEGDGHHLQWRRRQRQRR